jgi:hypothetical protein
MQLSLKQNSNWRTDNRIPEILEQLEAETGRKWHRNDIGEYTAFSYANNNMSYAYDYLTDNFMLVQGIDGFGVNGLVTTLFTGSFDDCRVKFYDLKP